MNWLNILNMSQNEGVRRATLRIDGVVGFNDWWDESNNTASHFMSTVDALGELDEIDIEINSPGGVVSDGVAITNYLIIHPAKVNVNVIGQAASIASVIAQAADEGCLHMGLGTTMFVHDPLTIMIGDADDMRDVADDLDKIRDSIVTIYQRHSDLSSDEIKDLMRMDTLMTAEEAVEWGFADTMDAELKAVACTDLNEAMALATSTTRSAMANRTNQQTDTGTLRSELDNVTAQLADANEKIQALTNKPDPAAAKDIIAACKEAGLSYLAMNFVEQNLTMDRVTDHLNTARQINDLCTAVNIDGEAVLAQIGSPVGMLRIALNELEVALDPGGDNTFTSGAFASGQLPNAGEIYAKRKQ